MPVSGWFGLSQVWQKKSRLVCPSAQFIYAIFAELRLQTADSTHLCDLQPLALFIPAEPFAFRNRRTNAAPRTPSNAPARASYLSALHGCHGWPAVSRASENQSRLQTRSEQRISLRPGRLSPGGGGWRLSLWRSCCSLMQQSCRRLNKP